MDCSRQSLLRKNEKPSVLILNDLRKTSKMAECCWQKKQLKVWLMNGYLFRVSMKMDEEDHKPRQALPVQFCGQSVAIKALPERIEIFHSGNLIAVHQSMP